jgi:hypothetical protein
MPHDLDQTAVPPFFRFAGGPTHSRVSNVWDQESVKLLALPLIPKAGVSGAPECLYTSGWDCACTLIRCHDDARRRSLAFH